MRFRQRVAKEGGLCDPKHLRGEGWGVRAACVLHKSLCLESGEGF